MCGGLISTPTPPPRLLSLGVLVVLDVVCFVLFFNICSFQHCILDSLLGALFACCFHLIATIFAVEHWAAVLFPQHRSTLPKHLAALCSWLVRWLYGTHSLSWPCCRVSVCAVTASFCRNWGAAEQFSCTTLLEYLLTYPPI